MDQIKEAFVKVKDDINRLNLEVSELKKEFENIKTSTFKLVELVNKLNSIVKIKLVQQTDKPTDRQTNTPTHSSTDTPTQESQIPTLQHIISTDFSTPTHSSTDNSHFKGLKEANMEISTGNRGVPTDKQTDKQTNRQTHFPTQNPTQNYKKPLEIPSQIIQSTSPPTLTTSLVLSQLDSIKKEIRLKIKRLTNQEMLIFSSIYQFDEQGEIIDYSFLSNKLNLSESSIRDYTQRIIAKGLPIIKEKINNKRIILHISPDLKKFASLNTLISLRNL